MATDCRVFETKDIRLAAYLMEKNQALRRIVPPTCSPGDSMFEFGSVPGNLLHDWLYGIPLVNAKRIIPIYRKLAGDCRAAERNARGEAVRR